MGEMSKVEEVARAMELKRRELIAQPLSRIWGDLAEAAIAEIRQSPKPTNQMFTEKELKALYKCRSLDRILLHQVVVSRATAESLVKKGMWETFYETHGANAHVRYRPVRVE